MRRECDRVEVVVERSGAGLSRARASGRSSGSPVNAGAEAASFSGHESFPLRYGWLKKCVDAVASRADFFAHDDAMVALGVGKNMVRAVRHWGLTARVVEPADDRGRALRVSALGALVFGADGVDPYLEDVRTLWLVHWLLCTHPERATTWRWAFGACDRQALTRDALRRDLLAVAGPSRATEATVARDIDVFLRTYLPSRASRQLSVEDALDSPLVELRLLREDPVEPRVEFVRGPKPSLADEVFGFALLEFWARAAGERDTLGVDELLQRHGSPARVFRLDEGALAARVERAAQWSRGALLYDETAGVRQLLRRRRVEPLAWLTAALEGGRA